ncbi:MAG TPA: hypothetical protein VFC30_05875 [Solirubrobacteraceae bacterium]|nr:hypothetical protein [Solirubrobacteraceae bacterium]
MSRRSVVVALGALLLASPVVAQAQNTTQTPVQESGNPINDQGGNYNYRSYVTQVAPGVPGVSLHVLEFADRLILTNHSGQTVTVLGYQGEPYGRVLADGTVQLNTSSPAYYLNQNFYGDVNVPASATATATPHWTVVDRTGRLEWHDHRIHWMSPALPPQVKNKAKRTKIFNWRVPIEVGARKATVDGELFWTPEGVAKAPTAAIAALVVFAVLGLLLVLFVRRRRSGTPPDLDSPAKPGGAKRAGKEAW